MKRTYRVQGRYGYWAVDEHSDQGSGVRGPLAILKTRKLADQVAEALNQAYAHGGQDAADVSRETVTRP